MFSYLLSAPQPPCKHHEDTGLVCFHPSSAWHIIGGMKKGRINHDQFVYMMNIGASGCSLNSAGEEAVTQASGQLSPH